MTRDRRTRFIALSGAAWAVLAVAGVVTASGETPNADARPLKVITYYASHKSEIEASAILFALAFLFFLLFCGTLRAFLRRNPANDGLATLMLVAAAVVTGAAGVGGG